MDETRQTWARITGLPEDDPATDHAAVFEQQLRNLWQENPPDNWDPVPNAEQLRVIKEVIREQIQVLPIDVSLFDTKEQIIAEYFVTVGVEEAEESNSSSGLVWAAVLAAGVGGALMAPPKKLGLRLLVGSASSAITLIVINKFQEKKA